MSSSISLGIIGCGPSAVFLLKHLSDQFRRLDPPLRSISIYDKSGFIGMGMPYSPETTEVHNLSNISSGELPELVVSFADWLLEQTPATLEELGVKQPVEEDAIYPRLALGRYLQAQCRALLSLLKEEGVEIREFPACRISDVRAEIGEGGVTVTTGEGMNHHFDRVVIATGHHWPERDDPEAGRYSSPWPIHKLLPPEGVHFNFPIGTLGASLSAFDVVNSLAHRHGTFKAEKDGPLRYEPAPGTEKFRIVMHSAQGLLPHLQFAQEHPMREIYRHVGREQLVALMDARGFLRLERYFDKVCRPVLLKAFGKDGMREMVELLSRPSFQLRDFVEKMTDEHDYAPPFEVMRDEMAEARNSVINNKPIHWKESMDDLMYTLNFHAELLPAEDHLTLAAEVMPFLMNVIAAMPLPSGETMLALHEAGKLEVVAGKVEIAEQQPNRDRTRIVVKQGREENVTDYRMFIDCSGQKPLGVEDYPFRSMVERGKVRRALALFADPKNVNATVPEEKRDKLATVEGGRLAFEIGGLEVDSSYRLMGADGKPDPRLCEISFPFISGLRPYSYGLQACNDTARLVVNGWTNGSGPAKIATRL